METPNIKYLKDYRPTTFMIGHIDLTFELDETRTRVTSVMTVFKNPNSEPDAEPNAENGKTDLVLNGRQMELESIAINGKPLPQAAYKIDDNHLTIFDPLSEFNSEEFKLHIVTIIDPTANTSLDGLYYAGGIFNTQCEAEGFRKITYYYDRPDVMATFSCKIIADRKKYPVLLSNGNLIGQGTADNGQHWARWEDPFKKPCYLFALVAGDLICIADKFTTCSGREINLEIYVEPGNQDKCDHAMQSLKKAMKWDEDVYGREYDLDIYMIVAVDNFNMGAMENKGLNIFNSKYVLAKPDTATDEDFLNIERVIAHEYFHNWTGNRVTLKNWFQLSLKEGLTVFRDQEFAADMSSAAVKRISDVAKLRIFQFPEDAGPTAHPVLPESYIEMNNFYTMTVYEKGSEIIRMIRLLTGREGFRKGMDLYFERFDGMAVTCEDFVKTMEDANNIDLAQFRLWYSQAGTPVIRFERKWDENEKSFCLTLAQDCPKTPGQDKKLPMHIPVEIGLLDSDGGQIPLQLAGEKKASGTSRILDFTEAKQDFTFVNIDPAHDENLRKNGPVPSLFRKFSAPVKLVAGYTEDERIFLMGNDPDPFNRWDAGQQLFSSMILSLIDDFQNKKELVISSALLEAFEKTLTASSDLTADKIMDKAFVAHALRLPSESELGEMMAGRGLIIDPDGIFHVRKFVISHLAEEFSAIFTKIYEQNSVKEPYSIDSESIARRSLKNLALFYLGRKDLGRKESQSMIPLVYNQFENADNMTDAIAALLILGDTDTYERTKAFDTFYQRWQSDTLVLDKWFALQAVSSLPDTLNRVKELMDHPAFSIKNPNKVRSLVFAFCNGNPFRFHDISGSGYEFITDRILELNTLNPQIGARLVAAFNHWKKYDTDRQGLMKIQLKKILDTPKLSKDIFEIVSKAIA